MSENREKYPHKDIGNRLKAIRKSTGMNIKSFAALMDINYTRYINWETGERRLMPEDASLFCDKFEVSLDFIYRGKLRALPENIIKEVASIPRDSAQSKSNEMPESSAS